jgi:uncharacterized membrane protein HdeD (DUF308 family)
LTSRCSVSRIVMEAVASDSTRKVKVAMLRITGLWMGIVAITVGILIIALPGLLRWILGIALILMGVMAVIPALKR